MCSDDNDDGNCDCGDVYEQPYNIHWMTKRSRPRH